jgi:thioredoxin-dependent peroxiredoxin
MNLKTGIPLLFFFALLTIAVPARGGNPTEFTVNSATSTNVFTLSAAKGKFVALHFLLKTECPYCLRYTQSYAQKSAGDTNVVHVFLKPDSDAEIKEWTTKLGEAAPLVNVHRDPNAMLAKAFEIPDGYKFHGQTVHFPALVLLNPHGKEVFRYVGKNNSDRLPYEKFAAKLQELTPPSPH